MIDLVRANAASERRYRIAVISYHTSPLAPLGGRDTGGLNVYVRELARELSERGHWTDVYTRRTGIGDPEVEPIGPGDTPFARVIRVDAGPHSELDKEGLPDHVDAFVDGVAAFAEREALTYDVLHSHYWLSGLAAEALKQRLGAPHIAMFHTLGEVKNRARVSEHEPAPRLRGERRVSRGAERLVVASENERDLLVRLYGADAERISVVPCGVNLDMFRPIDKSKARKKLGLGGDDRILLFVGRIEPLKGVDILLGAAAQLDSDADCFVLVVGGDSASGEGEMGHLRSLAAQLGIAERVSFLGAVDHERLPLFYSAADVCVVPSYYESFGLVALEAMACGTPVVASRVGGMTGTVRDGETGYLIPWRCPEPFAERLELLLGNEGLRRAFGQSAQEAVERFRWSNVADAVLGLYREGDRARRPDVRVGQLACRHDFRGSFGRGQLEPTNEELGKDGPLTAMVIFAHPDDAEFTCGGTVAKWCAQGWTVYYVLVTSGDKGTHDAALSQQELAAIREQEQRDACRTLGVREVIFLGHPDGFVEANDELRGTVVRLLRKYRPDVVVTWDGFRKGFNHNDHRAVGIAVRDAVYPAVRDHLYYPEDKEAGLEAHQVNEMLLAGTDEADYHVDISAHMQTKLDAVVCHASQLGGRGPEEVRKLWEERMRSSRNGPPRESFKRVSIRRPVRQEPREAAAAAEAKS